MTDRLPCRACGHLILPTTAARNDGLCIPCKGGYRQTIEDGKPFHTERRRYLASPQALYWSALVNRVYDGGEGFAGLSPAERSYYAVSVLSGEVHNGGFDQYFGNSSGDQYQAARGSSRIGGGGCPGPAGASRRPAVRRRSGASLPSRTPIAHADLGR